MPGESGPATRRVRWEGPITLGPAVRLTHPRTPAARRRRSRTLASGAALGVLLLGPAAHAFELTVEGPTVEDARGTAVGSRAPEVGEELYIRCRLAAQGSDPPGTVRFVFRVDGTVIRELSVPVTVGAPIAIGEYWKPATAGPHEVACEAGPERKGDAALHVDHARRRTVEVRPRGSAPAPPSGPGAPGAPAPPAAAAPAPAAPAAPAPGTGPAKPDLAIVAVTTVGDPGCGPREPSVTARVTVKNVSEAAFVPSRNPAMLETAIKIANQTALAGRTPLPRLGPGDVAELEVVARNRLPIPDAGGLRYSVVIIVNGESRVEEVTLDNNGEYVKAIFPRC